jgi:hypothetical protein
MDLIGFVGLRGDRVQGLGQVDASRCSFCNSQSHRAV